MGEKTFCLSYIPTVHKLSVNSSESLVSTTNLVNLLSKQFDVVVRELNNKTNRIYSKLQNASSIRKELELLSEKLEKKQDIDLSLYFNIDTFGFSLEGCVHAQTVLNDFYLNILKAYNNFDNASVSLIDNFTDIYSIDSVSKLEFLVKTEKVKFFQNIQITDIDDVVNKLMDLNKSIESLNNIKSVNLEIINKIRQFYNTLKSNVSVDSDMISDDISNINNRIDKFNNILNSCAILECYNRVVNYVFIDAVSNIV